MLSPRSSCLSSVGPCRLSQAWKFSPQHQGRVSSTHLGDHWSSTCCDFCFCSDIWNYYTESFKHIKKCRKHYNELSFNITQLQQWSARGHLVLSVSSLTLSDSSGPLMDSLWHLNPGVEICVCVFFCVFCCMPAVGLFVCSCAPYSNIFNLFCFLVEQATFCSVIAKLA